MKCQKCSKIATLHITEIVSDEHFEELHLCEECAHKYLYEPSSSSVGSMMSGAWSASEAEEEIGNELLSQQCSICGIKFVEFRNTGRLGCPHDYEAFRNELVPLLENIHGVTKHRGKIPQRSPEAQQRQTQLVDLRRQLQQAIDSEAYEQAAQLRDRIRHLEEQCA